MDKDILRKQMRQKRDSFDKDLLDNYNKEIYNALLACDDVKNAKTLFIYVSMGSEVDTHKLINTLILMDKKICIPVVCGKELKLSYMESFKKLERTSLGILEPTAESFIPCDKESIDVTIVPGLAFDKKGYRIGYGGGYYDKLLPQLGGVKIGVCYDFCIVKDVFPKAYDVKVDYVISNLKGNLL